MSLAPLLAAPAVIRIHALAAVTACALCALQLAAPKGTARHSAMGWLWIALMTVVAVSGFWIHETRLWGPWSPIHLLSAFTLASLPVAVAHARARRIADHRNAMVLLFTGALAIAGALTLPPGRLMHAVLLAG